MLTFFPLQDTYLRAGLAVGFLSSHFEYRGRYSPRGKKFYIE